MSHGSSVDCCWLSLLLSFSVKLIYNWLKFLQFLMIVSLVNPLLAITTIFSIQTVWYPLPSFYHNLVDKAHVCCCCDPPLMWNHCFVDLLAESGTTAPPQGWFDIERFIRDLFYTYDQSRHEFHWSWCCGPTNSRIKNKYWYCWHFCQ